MHVHKPKPMHNLREFLGEVGVIAIGILLALGAEQLIEAWHWSHKVDAAEMLLADENRDNYGQAVELMAVAPCVVAQLGTVEAHIGATAGGFRPVPLYQDTAGVFVVRQPSRAWATDAWESLLADGTAAHLDARRRKSFSDAYLELTTLKRLNGDAELTSVRLSVLAKPLTLDEASRVHEFELIEEQKARVARQAISARDYLMEIRRLHIVPASLPRYVLAGSETRKFCADHNLPLADWEKQVAAEERRLN